MSNQKRAAFSILSFLQSSIDSGSIKSDDVEGIEVAIQCISEAFGVDLDAEADKKSYSIEPETLSSVLEKHVQSAAAAAVPVAAAVVPVSAEDKAKAEKAKSLGNQLMAAKDYPGAIKAYGDAIALDGSAPTYYSNRAAAHAQLSAHDAAITDARTAISIDPKFTKAYSRLGHALFSSGLYPEAVEAYEQGLKLDPTNATMKSSLATAKSRVPSLNNAANDDEDEDESSSVTPAARGAGGMPAGFPNFPGMGGAGGMPDLASMMQNPAIMQMAQSMMANGGLETLMQNPMLQSMMGGGGAGGSMPDINALMNDPQMRAMAESMGLGGAPRGGANNSGSDTNADMYS